MESSRIGTQVKLPASVAFEVVMQGFRIRLGRSVVTMFGIILGIAFLMSVLSGDVIKKSVAREEGMRNSVRRMANFLTAEVGPPVGRKFAVLLSGQLSEEELRFIRHLRQNHAKEITYAPVQDAITLPVELDEFASKTPLDTLADGAHALLVFGNGKNQKVDWSTLLENSYNRVVGFTGAQQRSSFGKEVTVIRLDQQLREDELKRIRENQRKAVYRRNWIVIISLVASVICISNAMLMSVTERFREIGTMKCLGALSSFIRQMFLIESSLLGTAGSLIGAIGGLMFSLMAYSVTYGVGLVFGSLVIGPILFNLALCLIIGMVLSILAALYPAAIASRMVPANALRTNI